MNAQAIITRYNKAEQEYNEAEDAVGELIKYLFEDALANADDEYALIILKGKLIAEIPNSLERDAFQAAINYKIRSIKQQ